MDWLRSHLYLSSLVGATLLLFLGIFVVQERASVQPQASEPRAWGGTGANFSNPISDVRPSTTQDVGAENIMQQIQAGPPFFYTPPAVQNQIETSSGDNGFDFNAFIATLSKPHAQAGISTQQNDTLFADAYSFIPRGMISMSTPIKKRTPSQEALYQYGNEAGSIIQPFEEAHPNMPQILKDQFEDPQNPVKVGALNSLGNALANVGHALQTIENIPPSAAAANAALAKNYQEIGKKLQGVPKTQGDQERINAMLAYDTSVEAFIKNYVALATTFSTFDVTFAASDPGSVFVFTNTSF